jgi:hypothetical protein
LAKKKASSDSKQITREHIISFLSVNFVGRIILRSNCIFEEIQRDYGYDLTVTSYNHNFEIENGPILIQLKASNRIVFKKRTGKVAFTVKKADLKLWMGEPAPVLLCLYDVQQDHCYWMYVQQYFKGFRVDQMKAASKKVELDPNNLFTEAVLTGIVAIKNKQVILQVQAALGTLR